MLLPLLHRRGTAAYSGAVKRVKGGGVHGRIRTCDPRIHTTSVFTARKASYEGFSCLWSGLSLYHEPRIRELLDTARPVSTPSCRQNWLAGLARDWHAMKSTAKLSPNLSRSVKKISLLNAQFLGILCSILLSYAD